MSVANLDALAVLLGDYIRRRLPDINRAALLVRSTLTSNGIAAVFGNDGYQTNPAARREVELLRQQLRQAEIEEIGFGVSSDGRTWVLLIKADNSGFQTELGKSFRIEMLRACLDDAVRTAWQMACAERQEQENRLAGRES
jgi:hypothetical protein